MTVTWEQFSVNRRQTKTKVIALWPITTDADIPMNQSELEANTWSRHQARKKCVKSHNWFKFYLDCVRKWRKIFFFKCSNAKPKTNANCFDT